MLSVREILRANNHQRATGQRSMGHFDRDASNSAGPLSDLAHFLPSAAPVTSTSDESEVVTYPTGERIELLPSR